MGRSPAEAQLLMLLAARTACHRPPDRSEGLCDAPARGVHFSVAADALRAGVSSALYPVKRSLG